MTDYRIDEAQKVRVAAAKLAADRPHPAHQANGDEQRYASARYAMSFTKGLEHDPDTGLIQDAAHFEAFRAAIDNGFVDVFTTSVPVACHKERPWEAPTAGLVYDLQGPDSHAVTMPPAPALGSNELAYEMAEVYELALLRDTALTAFVDGTANQAVKDAVDRLNAIGYKIDGSEGRPRKNVDGKVTAQTVFRGSSPGVDVGPYLSQFMLIGTDDRAGTAKLQDGKISYGALQINQRVPVAVTENYMVSREDWLDVQNGKNVRDNDSLFECAERRFIIRPRDMATYVHDDELYESYLNACLILLVMKAPTDPAFTNLSGPEGATLAVNCHGVGHDKVDGKGKKHHDCDSPRFCKREAGGFALWGGPHILTLVTEVATRALKAVRYQKFNTHCRLRPEALAGRIERATDIETAFPWVDGAFSALETAIQATVDAVSANNPTNTKLLPMAFQEGSPMHPSYGAGHATVAGACVTILKAFFDTNAVLVERNGKVGFARYKPGDTAIHYVPDDDGSNLVPVRGGQFLTLEGELNKLAANISIARNMAGVHYFSDYYDSLRMGEAIAIGILEEQALCYKTDPFVQSVPTFDGQVRRIGKR